MQILNFELAIEHQETDNVLVNMFDIKIIILYYDCDITMGNLVIYIFHIAINNFSHQLTSMHIVTLPF
jgi:hypothetical protein